MILSKRDQLRFLTCSVILIMSLSSCSKNEPVSSESTMAPLASETTVETTSVDENYVHGEDGYYSSVDEGYGTQVGDQKIDGRCGFFASRTCAEINYNKKTGGKLLMDMDTIIDICAGTDKDEGIVVGTESYLMSVTGNLSYGDDYDGYFLDRISVFRKYEGGDGDIWWSNGLTIDEVKEFIREEGAIMADLKYGNPSSWGMHYGYMTSIDYSRTDDLNHWVCIVGYDDHFPKEYFGQIPEHDGAWLVQNSFGTSFGNDGYYWVSYDSTVIFHSFFSVSDKYSEVLSYGTGLVYAQKSFGEDSTGACVFDHKGKLAGVGVYVYPEFIDDDSDKGMVDAYNNAKFDVTVEVRDSDMNEVLCSKDAHFDYEGYYVVEFDESLEVEKYSIVVTYHNGIPIPFEGSSFEKRPMVDYIASGAPGQSFVLMDGEWVDVTDQKVIDAVGMDEGEPNDMCVKAVYVE